MSVQALWVSHRFSASRRCTVCSQRPYNLPTAPRGSEPRMWAPHLLQSQAASSSEAQAATPPAQCGRARRWHRCGHRSPACRQVTQHPARTVPAVAGNWGRSSLASGRFPAFLGGKESVSSRAGREACGTRTAHEPQPRARRWADGWRARPLPGVRRPTPSTGGTATAHTQVRLSAQTAWEPAFPYTLTHT